MCHGLSPTGRRSLFFLIFSVLFKYRVDFRLEMSLRVLLRMSGIEGGYKSLSTFSMFSVVRRVYSFILSASMAIWERIPSNFSKSFPLRGSDFSLFPVTFYCKLLLCG
jgi:hypothetical protein